MLPNSNNDTFSNPEIRNFLKKEIKHKITNIIITILTKSQNNYLVFPKN